MTSISDLILGVRPVGEINTYNNSIHTAKKRLTCTNVVENRPEQYFAAHIVPGSVNDIVQHCSAEQC